MKNDFQIILNIIQKSTKRVEILPSAEIVNDSLIRSYKTSDNKLLMVLLDNVGGIVIDNWIRIYGSGELNIISRNSLSSIKEIVIAEDVLGGLFVLLENGNIGYFAPDILEIEDTEMNLRDFLYWCFFGETDRYYMDYRWEEWQKDTEKLKLNEGISFYPFLFTEADRLECRSRKIVPIDEIINIEFYFSNQINMIGRDNE